MFTGSRQSRAVASKIKNAQERAAAAGQSNDDSGDQAYRSSVNFQAWPFVISLAATELVAGPSYAFH
jgi:hypothetical protein